MSHADTLAHIEKAKALIDGLDMHANFAALLAEKAAANGDATAVDFFQSGDRLSYAEIDETTDRLADALMQMGVRKGTHVALVTPNSPGFVLSWLAVAKIGAVMVPVNPTYTVRENDLCLGRQRRRLCDLRSDVRCGGGSGQRRRRQY